MAAAVIKVVLLVRVITKIVKFVSILVAQTEFPTIR